MCGIAGIMNLSGDDDYSSTLNKMMDKMYNRGPDSGGSYTDNNIFLGMRRLSIMDKSDGDQPFSFNDNRIQLIFNGEIYNYHSMRKVLESSGFIFKTDCDTEVIGHAYQHYGEDFEKYLDGMFAIALWDDRKKTLFLIRDRLGIKPLYYFFNNSKFVFSSNIKSILECPFVSKDIDYGAMSDYLTKRFTGGNRTIFKEIHKFPPGNQLKLTRNEKQFFKYWDLNSILEKKEPKSNNTDEIIYDLKNNFENAVSSHLMSDVPVGAFLSGGVDSTSIVALMSKYSNFPINTYSVGFSKNSELEHARKVANHFSTNHNELMCEAPTIEQLIEMFYELEEPIIDPAIMPTYYVSKLASKDVKVVLTGEGSDEINGGYKKYLHSLTYNELPLSVLKYSNVNQKKNILKFLERYNNKISRFLQYYISKSFITNQLFDFVDSDLMWKGDVNSIFSGTLSNSIGNLISTNELVTDELIISSSLQNHFLNDINDGWLTNQLLLKVDKMSMASSLEARVPFLDHHLLEYALSIPPEMKIKNKITKSLFRDLLKNIIPSQIINRKQHGFIVPIDSWFNNEWSGMLDSFLLSGSLMNSGNFQTNTIKNIINRSKSGDSSVNSLLWSLLSMELWHESFFK